MLTTAQHSSCHLSVHRYSVPFKLPDIIRSCNAKKSPPAVVTAQHYRQTIVVLDRDACFLQVFCNVLMFSNFGK